MFIIIDKYIQYYRYDLCAMSCTLLCTGNGFLGRQYGTQKEIDLSMRPGYGWNVRPFEIADNAGPETIVRQGKKKPHR